ncbi:hypothetical protein [Jiangella anatolica]|uniref:Uncharacterized protein n=1 Tax=Jiangella anatolica TaxID=2670374 RepID=A0A2W2CBT5_9ACTN|nr:hypothetical protein [Jiangella anatolica]PZF83236.1 hypothetical protein C1I92_13240 [Jiangella anatolica]
MAMREKTARAAAERIAEKGLAFPWAESVIREIKAMAYDEGYRDAHPGNNWPEEGENPYRIEKEN